MTEREQLPYPALAPKVLAWFEQTTRPRNWCLKMACSPWLDYVSILVVLLNCMSLGMYKPGGERSYKLEIVDFFVLAFFVMEMLVKMLAKGGYGYEGSYLSNPWNKLDLFINSVEVFDYFLVYVGLHLPVCQVLGPMRLIGRVTSMRDVVTVLLDISPMLVNVFILNLFFINIFEVMGVRWFLGVQHLVILASAMIHRHHLKQSQS